ncbi:uncharacterized protein (TIGR02646 family) [Stenotrophomonas sp. 1278]|uniref:hypothetical protein n=1 Tax=Stenotrophomonas sp. 1278 TaxID=2940566 RepID=UPI0024733086|nr:hypothetical protein [Stenotrophomonas sp. 1278]MDH6331229.1 uncharacterized protein (TIGR02646 family) [Stenotrophomonas sp. 1278]
MIHIKKTVVPPSVPVYNKASVGPKGSQITPAASELANAIAFFTDGSNYADDKKITKKRFIFKVYKNTSISEELEKVFGTKCAYCESRFGAVTPKDVEHYRPKSEVLYQKGSVIAPGYYWLAGDWSNLLVSCADCNRARSHLVPGQPKKTTIGKHTQFPLSDESIRVRLHSLDVATEEPHRLLLHPCIDQPEEHLTYDSNGLISPIVAGDQKAATSIFVYALQRKGLVEERKRVLNDLQLKLDLLKSLAVELNSMDGTTPTSIRQGKLDQIGLQMKGICLMFAHTAPYLGMLRDYIRRNLLAGTFVDIRNANIDLGRLLP